MSGASDADASADRQTPRVSFGVPVWNGERFIRRAVDSLLGQTLHDVEVVISDNASTDRTPEIAREYADADPRVHVHRNETNLGVLENFNRLPRLARGTYYRWLGCDDWLEPEYAEACVAAFEANPEAIAVTTFQAHIDDEGRRKYREYRGPRVTSSEPHERFGRMLWFLTQEHWLMDPIFSMYRRDVLLSTTLHRHMARADRILAAELSLKGPYAHVPRQLSNRRWVHETEDDVRRRVQPPKGERIVDSELKRYAELRDVIASADLTDGQRTRCELHALRYFVHDVRHERWRRRLRRRLRWWAGDLARRVGIDPSTLRTRSDRSSEVD